MVDLSFVFEGLSSENRWEHWNVECEAVTKMSVIFLVHAIPCSLRHVSVWSLSQYGPSTCLSMVDVKLFLCLIRKNICDPT